MMKRSNSPTFLPMLASVLLTLSCTIPQRSMANAERVMVAAPKYETTPVPSHEDSADDAAIWLHPDNPQASKIIGTNKRSGVLVYNLKGEQLFHWNQDPMNNVDVRYNFPFQGKRIDIVAGSSKDSNSFRIFKMEGETGHLVPVSQPIKIESNAYGFCLFHDIRHDTFYAFITGKDGKVSQWLIKEDGRGQVVAEHKRTLSLSSQTEGCVADDEYAILYASEEAVGLWKFPARPDEGDQATMVASIRDNPNLTEDLEGVTLYQTRHGQGYILLSVQTNDQFAIFDRTGKNSYLMSFSIREGKDIDPVTHTDGIDVISTNLGPDFPLGIFVTQDDENHPVRAGDPLENQNFKLVPWQSIAKAAPFPLMMDNTWNPREMQDRSAKR